MARQKLQYATKYLTAPQVRLKLGLKRVAFDLRLERGLLPKPTFIDPDTNVRYFDEAWLRVARFMLDSMNNNKP